MAAAGGICPPEWEALLDDLCERFPFAAESHVLCMLTAAQGDAEVVAECLSEYPAARLCQPWILPGEYDACGLWRPVSEVFRRLRADASAPAAPAWTTSHHLRPRRSRNGVSGNPHELTPLSPLRPRGLSGGGLNAFLERVWAVGGCSSFSVL